MSLDNTISADFAMKNSRGFRCFSLRRRRNRPVNHHNPRTMKPKLRLPVLNHGLPRLLMVTVMRILFRNRGLNQGPLPKEEGKRERKKSDLLLISLLPSRMLLARRKVTHRNSITSHPQHLQTQRRGQVKSQPKDVLQKRGKYQPRVHSQTHHKPRAPAEYQKLAQRYQKKLPQSTLQLPKQACPKGLKAVREGGRGR